MGSNSAYGVVYDTCCGENCDHVTKIVPFVENESNREVVRPDQFMEELTFQAEAAALGVAPAIRNVYLTPTHGMVVMDRMSKSFFTAITDAIEDRNASEGARVANQLGAALFALHRNGILHMDVHEGNVMLDSKGDVKLIDFGIASRIPPVMARIMRRFPTASAEEMAKKAYEREYLILSDWHRIQSDIIRSIRALPLADRPQMIRSMEEVEGAFKGTLQAWYEKDLDFWKKSPKARSRGQ